MSDGQVLAARNLPQEERDDAAMRAENISEANGAAVGARRRPAKNCEFGEALRSAHDAARIRSFIGGNEKQLRDVVIGGEARKIPSDQRVVANRREGIRFHQRNVFEGSGVIKHRRAIFFEERREKPAIPGVAKHCKKRRCRGTRGKGSFDFVEILFGVIEQDK